MDSRLENHIDEIFKDVPKSDKMVLMIDRIKEKAEAVYIETCEKGSSNTDALKKAEEWVKKAKIIIDNEIEESNKPETKPKKETSQVAKKAKTVTKSNSDTTAKIVAKKAKVVVEKTAKPKVEPTKAVKPDVTELKAVESKVKPAKAVEPKVELEVVEPIEIKPIIDEPIIVEATENTVDATQSLEIKTFSEPADTLDNLKVASADVVTLPPSAIKKCQKNL